MAETIKGMDSLMRKLDSLGGNVLEALRGAVKDTALAAEASAKANAPSSKHSQADSEGGGSLKGSITHEVKASGGRIEGRVYTKNDHAAYVEFGTGPVGAANHAGISPNVPVSYTSRRHWVYPLTIGGEKTFRTTSGQPARPYMFPAAVEHKDTFRQTVRQRLEQAIRRTAGGG